MNVGLIVLHLQRTKTDKRDLNKSLTNKILAYENTKSN